MKVYTIVVRCGGPKTTAAMLRLVARKLPGLLGGSCDAPAGVLCFGSRGHAKRAWRLLLNSGWKVGKYIMEAEIDLKEHRIQVGQPVDGWESVDPDDLRVDGAGNRSVVMRYKERETEMRFMNKQFNVETVRDSIKLKELMRLIPNDEFVIIYTPLKEFTMKFREEEALFNGQAGDWWEETAENATMREMMVVGFKASELETVAGPVILIVAQF